METTTDYKLEQHLKAIDKAFEDLKSHNGLTDHWKQYLNAEREKTLLKIEMARNGGQQVLFT